MSSIGKVPISASANGADVCFERNEAQEEELLTNREKEEERVFLWRLVLSCAHCAARIRRGKF